MRRSSAKRRWLAVELLEDRRLLANVSVQTREYRTDTISLSGSYSYSELGGDWEDRVPNGSFTSQTGELRWSGPQNGSGEFTARATGSGSNRGVAAGGWHDCSSFTLQEDGYFKFSIDAAAKTIHVRNSWADSLQFLSYRDLTPIAVCPQPDPWPRFFVGYGDGTLDPINQTFSRSYLSSSTSYPVTATIPSTPFQYGNQQAADWSLQVTTQPGEFYVPDDWVRVTPNSPPGVPQGYDPNVGVLDIVITEQGLPFAPGSDVLQPVAKLKMTWTDSPTDARQEPVPIPDAVNPPIYWNTSRIEAKVADLPAPPQWARYLKVELDLNGRSDASPTNHRVYLPVQISQLSELSSGPLLAGEKLDGGQNQLLSPIDAADPKLTVWSYQALSEMGVPVTVLDKQGHFTYDPGPSLDWSYLNAGESLTDKIQFQAAYDGAYGIFATHSVVLMGVNDIPLAEDDAFYTDDSSPLALTIYEYLSNDFDLDLDDEVTVKSIASVSALGVALQVDADGTIAYDPRLVPSLVALQVGASAEDTFDYVVTDKFGATASATVRITVNGSNSPPQMATVPPQFTVIDVPFAPIAFTVSDPDSDLASLQATVSVDDYGIVAEAIVTGSPGSWQLQLTPAPGVTGRTVASLYLSDAEGSGNSYRIPVTVGSPQDLDLDGIANDVELAGPRGGDMNQDGITDDRQANVASLPTATGEGYVCVAVAEEALLSQVSVTDTAAAQMPFGSVHYEIQPSSGEASMRSWLYVASQTTTANVAYRMVEVPAGGARWDRWMYNGNDGAVLHANRFQVLVSDGGVGDFDGMTDGKVVVNVAFGHVSNPWQNAVPEDVDNDSVVAALDALILINAINRGEGGALGVELVGNDEVPYFLDVSGDFSLAAIDALVVINWLNAPPHGEGEALARNERSAEVWGELASLLAAESARRKKLSLLHYVSDDSA